MNTKRKKVLMFVIIVIILAVALFIAQKSASDKVGSKYDAFAICLKDKGANFYGAFWCSHCQEQKELFGEAKKLLPYVECASTDPSGQTQICEDQKIESYPTWTFRSGIKIEEQSMPIVCAKKPGVKGEDPICLKAHSVYGKMWLFPESKSLVWSETEPVHTGNEWIFAVGSQLRGNASLTELASQTGCVLPLK